MPNVMLQLNKSLIFSIFSFSLSRSQPESLTFSFCIIHSVISLPVNAFGTVVRNNFWLRTGTPAVGCCMALTIRSIRWNCNERGKPFRCVFVVTSIFVSEKKRKEIDLFIYFYIKQAKEKRRCRIRYRTRERRKKKEHKYYYWNTRRD